MMGSSDYLSKTFGTTQSDAKKITISAWCKLGNLGSYKIFFWNISRWKLLK
jgi:hypothetical protein